MTQEEQQQLQQLDYHHHHQHHHHHLHCCLQVFHYLASIQLQSCQLLYQDLQLIFLEVCLPSLDFLASIQGFLVNRFPESIHCILGSLIETDFLEVSLLLLMFAAALSDML